MVHGAPRTNGPRAAQLGIQTNRRSPRSQRQARPSLQPQVHPSTSPPDTDDAVVDSWKCDPDDCPYPDHQHTKPEVAKVATQQIFQGSLEKRNGARLSAKAHKHQPGIPHPSKKFKQLGPRPQSVEEVKNLSAYAVPRPDGQLGAFQVFHKYNRGPKVFVQGAFAYGKGKSLSLLDRGLCESALLRFGVPLKCHDSHLKSILDRFLKFFKDHEDIPKPIVAENAPGWDSGYDKDRFTMLDVYNVHEFEAHLMGPLVWTISDAQAQDIQRTLHGLPLRLVQRMVLQISTSIKNFDKFRRDGAKNESLLYPDQHIEPPEHTYRAEDINNAVSNAFDPAGYHKYNGKRIPKILHQEAKRIFKSKSRDDFSHIYATSYTSKTRMSTPGTITSRDSSVLWSDAPSEVSERTIASDTIASTSKSIQRNAAPRQATANVKPAQTRQAAANVKPAQTRQAAAPVQPAQTKQSSRLPPAMRSTRNTRTTQPKRRRDSNPSGDVGRGESKRQKTN